MKRALFVVFQALAWAWLLVALPAIWCCGLCRGLADVSCLPEPAPKDGGPRRRYHGSRLTETDMARILGVHEAEVRRGEAKWQ